MGVILVVLVAAVIVLVLALAASTSRPKTQIVKPKVQGPSVYRTYVDGHGSKVTEGLNSESVFYRNEERTDGTIHIFTYWPDYPSNLDNGRDHGHEIQNSAGKIVYLRDRNAKILINKNPRRSPNGHHR